MLFVPLLGVEEELLAAGVDVEVAGAGKVLNGVTTTPMTMTEVVMMSPLVVVQLVAVRYADEERLREGEEPPQGAEERQRGERPQGERGGEQRRAIDQRPEVSRGRRTMVS